MILKSEEVPTINIAETKTVKDMGKVTIFNLKLEALMAFSERY